MVNLNLPEKSPPEDMIELEKTNVLLLGPTGSGKLVYCAGHQAIITHQQLSDTVGMAFFCTREKRVSFAVEGAS